MLRNLLGPQILAFGVLTCFISLTFGQDKQALPAGWGTTGADPDGYSYERDTRVRYSGQASLLISPKSTAVKEKFGSLVQSIRPDDLRGKRIRFSGFVKTENVDWSALWVRVDGPNIEMLDFSNMDDGSIKGTTEWNRYELVVDVPSNAEAVVFGVMLGGKTGKVWIDDLKLEAVGNNIKKTSNTISEADRREVEEQMKKTPKDEIDRVMKFYRSLPTQPRNLDFEQGAEAVNAPAKKP